MVWPRRGERPSETSRPGSTRGVSAGAVDPRPLSPADLRLVCGGVALLLLILALPIQTASNTTTTLMSDSEEEAKKELARRRALQRAPKARYRARHPDKVTAIQKRYREKHRTQIAEAKKRYRATHWERVRASERRYRETHCEQANAYRRRYRARQREKRRTADKVKALVPLRLTVTLTDFLKSPCVNTPMETYLDSFCQTLPSDTVPRADQAETLTLTDMDSGDLHPLDHPVWNSSDDLSSFCDMPPPDGGQWLDDLSDLSSSSDDSLYASFKDMPPPDGGQWLDDLSDLSSSSDDSLYASFKDMPPPMGANGWTTSVTCRRRLTTLCMLHLRTCRPRWGPMVGRPQ